MSDQYIRTVAKYISDSDKVLRRIHKRERVILLRTGGYGRAVMRRSIKRRKSVSPINSAPHAHVSGNRGFKQVLFGINPLDLSVTIGHLPYPRRKRRTRGGEERRLSALKPTPQLINEGGFARLMTKSEGGRRRLVNARYRPRPFREITFPVVNDFFRKLIAKGF